MTPSINPEITSIESLNDLRNVHAQLLEELDQLLGDNFNQASEADAIHKMQPEILGFLEKGAFSGNCLEDIQERIAGQALLDYWASALVRAGINVDRVQLARFDEQQLPLLPDVPRPYVGLEAFGENEKEFFFGRTADIKNLIDLIEKMPLIVVLGASGSGKSSLVMGGVLPRLKESISLNLRIIPPFTPGNTPLFHLMRAVQNGGDGTDKLIETDIQHLRKNPTYLSVMLGGASAPSALITIDQFEELFTLVGQDDRDIFVNCLAQFLEAKPNHRIILTMREEFKDYMSGLGVLYEKYIKPNDAWYFIRPMGYEELREVIEEPAKRVNLQFQPGIVDDLIQKVLGQPTVLPLLQFTLRALWENRPNHRNRITWDIYKQVGGYQGDKALPFGPMQALSNAADQFYNRLPLEDREEVKRILLELVRVDELLEVYRQPFLQRQLIAAGKANTRRVLDLLVENDYIRVKAGVGDKDKIVEIKHESLLRNWGCLIEWIAEKRETYKQRLTLMQAARRWEQANRPREGLLTGWQLQYAKQLSNLSELEQEFIDASEQAISKAERKKLRKLQLALASLLIGISVYFAFDYFFWQEYKKTWGVIEELKAMSQDERERYAENRLDSVAIYYWSKYSRSQEKDEKQDAIDKLVRVLQDADKKKLFDSKVYPVAQWQAMEKGIQSVAKRESGESSKEIQSVSEHKSEESPLVTLYLPKSKAVKEGMLQTFWRELAVSKGSLGISIPLRLVIEMGDEGYQVVFEQYNLQTSTEASHPSEKSPNAVFGDRTIETPSQAREDIPDRKESQTKLDIKFKNKNYSDTLLHLDSSFKNYRDVKELLDFYHKQLDARSVSEESELKDWWWVPRWTIPLWNALKYQGIYPPEYYLVLDGINQYSTAPARFPGEVIVGALHKEMLSFSKETVEAACQSTKGLKQLVDKLKADLVQKKSLSELRFLLESLSDGNATKNNTDCLSQVVKEYEKVKSSYSIEAIIDKAYSPGHPLRIAIAPDLKTFIAPDDVLDKGIQASIEELRKEIREERGVHIPGVRFRVDDELSPEKFRIEVYNEGRSFTASSTDKAKEILGYLKGRLNVALPLWITIQETAWLRDELPKGIREWLSERYDVSKLKLLLREILAEGWSKRPGLEASDVEITLLEGASLSHFSWLMHSLVFWEKVCGPLDYACLGEGLRNTQQARLNVRAGDTATSIDQVKLSGMGPLILGDLDEAGKQFEQWLKKTDSDTAKEVFVQAYGRVVEPIDTLELKTACSLEPGRFAAHVERAQSVASKLNAFMEDYGETLPPHLQRKMRLCQISSGFAQNNNPSLWKEKIETELSRHENWAPEEKNWLGYLSLLAHLGSDDAKDKAPPSYLDQIKELLLDALPKLPLQQAEAAFEEILLLCSDNKKVGAWCLDMLKPLPTLVENSYWIPFQLAFSFSQISRGGAEGALQLLNQAERNLHRIEENQQLTQAAWLSFVRGIAHHTLWSMGNSADSADADEAIKYFNEAAELSFKPKSNFDPGLAYVQRALVSFGAGDLESTKETLEKAEDKAKNEATRDEIELRRVVMLWAHNRFIEALESLEAAHENKLGPDLLYLRSLSRMFAPSPIDSNALKTDFNEFYKTSHDYRDYLRLAEYWTFVRMGQTEEATNRLGMRWNEINPSSWPIRLQPERGDYMSVWREKLIGFYMDKVTEEEIFDLLENAENFDSSPFANAEISRQGFLCEWYFYNALYHWIRDQDNRAFRNRLAKVISTDRREFHEYSIAKSLINRIDSGENFSLEDKANKNM